MNRREFIQAAAATTLAAGLGLNKSSVEPATASVDQRGDRLKQRKYWAWVGIDKKATSEALKAKYEKYKRHGIDAILLEGGIDEREFDIVKSAGLELHSWMWTTNRGDQWIRDHHPDWYQVSRTGKSCFDNPPYVNYYRWVSPVIPGVQTYLKERADELASHKAVSGVHLDYVRYPDIVLPRALWEKYHLDQTEELPDYDFCYSDHTRKAFKDFCGRDPLEIQDPAHDQQWLHFRYDSVTHLVKQLHSVVRGRHKTLTAAVFPTPRMARKICRQDWDKWPLDAVCPMTYNSFYNAPIDWIGDCVLENIHAVTFPVYAGLYMPDMQKPEDFQKAIKLVHQQGGFGVSLFGSVSDELWGIFAETIQSLA